MTHIINMYYTQINFINFSQVEKRLMIRPYTTQIAIKNVLKNNNIQHNIIKLI